MKTTDPLEMIMESLDMVPIEVAITDSTDIRRCKKLIAHALKQVPDTQIARPFNDMVQVNVIPPRVIMYVFERGLSEVEKDWLEGEEDS